MPEQLTTADGTQLDLDDSEQRFAAAMAAPPAGQPEPEAPAPPRREPVDPEAPYGRRLDGTPKKAPGGRPPKPREIEAAAAAAGGGSGRPGESRKTATGGQDPRDYTQGLIEFAEALHMVLSAVPVPHDELRVRVRVQAHVIKTNEAGLASGVNMMAQHNGTIRTGVEKLTTGSAGWVLPAVMAIAPFAVQTAALWRAPVAGDMEEVAAAVEDEWKNTFEAMKAEFTAEQAAAAEAPEAA